MPYEIAIPGLPAGYVGAPARKDEPVSVIVQEFTSSEDGDVFISRLDGIPTQILSKLPAEIQIGPSTIDHMLAIIRRDKTATVYVNEISFVAKVLIKGRDIRAGGSVYADDIADTLRLTLQNITIPNDAGVVFVFSYGWRKGLFYDLRPLLGQHPEPRDYDLEVLFGQYHAYLASQQLFKISDEVWTRLMAQQWFPFISLRKETIKHILDYGGNQWKIDDLTDSIAAEVADLIPSFFKKWQKSRLFDPHIALLSQATERFLQRDYISAAAILYPRIEGIMRTYHLTSHQDTSPTAHNLTESVISAKADTRHMYSTLLPEKFREYLEKVYFANFDPNDPKVLSRHTVAHGVAPADLFSQKSAVIGLLILDQITFFFDP